MRMWSFFGAFLAILVVTLGACKKEPKPPPPPPPMCAQFERGGSQMVGEVLCAQKDKDQDGIDDAVDLCVDLPEMMNDLEDGDGCPDPDRDRDGKMDYEDGCPDQAGTDSNGCPREDADKDGIPDHLDGCPNSAEDLDGEEDGDGCPEGAFLSKTDLPQLWQSTNITYRRRQARANEAGARNLVELVDSIEPVRKSIVRIKIHAAASRKEGNARFTQQELAEDRATSIQKSLSSLNLADGLFEITTEIYEAKDPRLVGEVSVEVFTRTASKELPKTPPNSNDVPVSTSKKTKPTNADATEKKNDPF
ncbi:MAG: hypothetical protein GY822_11360 [Deltaproteobacteria bacterium]|nr:hypothetical protein [Deltaproteobacteria bacterium]